MAVFPFVHADNRVHPLLLLLRPPPPRGVFVFNNWIHPLSSPSSSTPAPLHRRPVIYRRTTSHLTTLPLPSLLRVFRTGAIIILANVGRAENRARGNTAPTTSMGEEQEKSSQLEIHATPQPQQQPSHLLELLTGWSVIREDSPPPARLFAHDLFGKQCFRRCKKSRLPIQARTRSDKWACGRKVVASPFKNSLDSPQRIG